MILRFVLGAAVTFVVGSLAVSAFDMWRSLRSRKSSEWKDGFEAGRLHERKIHETEISRVYSNPQKWN
jgi:hypothetical protein